MINKRITESWATGVETVVTRDVYGSKDYNLKYQYYTISEMADGYTSIVEDMIDDWNQYSTYNSSRPDDQVSGYTLSQIESALPSNLGNWWTWRENLKNRYDNPTEDHLDKLFQDLK